MFEDLPTFVPQSVCLACDGCCRFKDEQSAWRPKAAPEEAAKDDALAQALDDRGYVRATTCAKHFQCVFFQDADNTCRVYGQRPFECRLYPFLLTKEEDGVALSVHLSCPYVQEQRHTKAFEDAQQSLKEYFQKDGPAGFIRENDTLARRYPQHEQEIERLFLIA